MNRIRLNQIPSKATGYPSDYGFVPDTLAEDGDPINTLVLFDRLSAPGCLVHARAMSACVLGCTTPRVRTPSCSASPRTTRASRTCRRLGDVPMHQISEIWHFFQIYEALEPDKSARTRTWENRKEAVQVLEAARRRFAEQRAA